MDIKEFKAGEYRQQYQYKSFYPSQINKEWVISDPVLQKLLEEANYRLGELNAFSLIVPDVDIFIQMHIVKEATTSNKIEGTQTNIEDAVLKVTDIAPEKREDWQEVQNYIKAINAAIEELSNLPISSRLIKHIHRILMESVRGEKKLPGEYRSSQNWIGGAGLRDAVFIPPHHTEIPELLNDLENFINNDSINVPHLVKIAIIHYQFETIHPFLDGNGRAGRLLITLYLVANKLLCNPTLYLSSFFEKNRQLYYDNLSLVRTNNNLTQWLKFFLTGVITTAENGIKTFQGILELKRDIDENKIILLGKKIALAKRAIRFLYKTPVVNAKDVVEELKITLPTANALIKDLIRLDILKEMTGFKRNKIYYFHRYLYLFNK